MTIHGDGAAGHGGPLHQVGIACHTKSLLLEDVAKAKYASKTYGGPGAVTALWPLAASQEAAESLRGRHLHWRQQSSQCASNRAIR